jgi:hypothetical protein
MSISCSIISAASFGSAIAMFSINEGIWLTVNKVYKTFILHIGFEERQKSYLRDFENRLNAIVSRQQGLLKEIVEELELVDTIRDREAFDRAGLIKKLLEIKFKVYELFLDLNKEITNFGSRQVIRFILEDDPTSPCFSFTRKMDLEFEKKLHLCREDQQCGKNSKLLIWIREDYDVLSSALSNVLDKMRLVCEDVAKIEKYLTEPLLLACVRLRLGFLLPHESFFLYFS